VTDASGPAASPGFAARFLVRPGERPDLRERDPADTAGWERQAADVSLDADRERLAGLQERLWAGRSRAVLVVLQGMDTSGKDGVIKNVIAALNPLGVRVINFGVPTEEELRHDYLWRVHREVPARGEVAVFNRSHYEDVLVVRVMSLVPEASWRGRYDEIAAFERLLDRNGTSVVKFFLHISPAEQRERLLARLADPEKRWKFRVGDLEARRRWDEFRHAYEEALARTSTDSAPWYVVPSDRKWFRNAVVASILVEILERLDLRFPEPEEELDEIAIP
jgi:PPK2 family polyphosphate:nucleotide phosphotransferase